MATRLCSLQDIENAKKTMIMQKGLRKVHYIFPENIEMIEEYDISKENLIVRKWKQKSTLGGDGPWIFEVGEPPALAPNLVTENLTEAYQNPKFTRCDTRQAFQWRVRNISYPADMYILDVENKQEIVLKTKNKKYYKRFDIPDMKRLTLMLDPKQLTFAYANNTLIISYEKPTEILEHEKRVKQLLKTLKPVDTEQGDCKTS